MALNSSIDFINDALSSVGLNEIDSLDDQTREAQIASIKYERTKSYFLARYTWNPNNKKVALALINTTPINEHWMFQYQLPSDCLKVNKITHKWGSRICDYNLSEQTILCNEENILLDYQTFLNESAFTPLMAKAFVALLQFEFAEAMQVDQANIAGSSQKYDRLLREARLTDANENKPIMIIGPDSGFVKARYSY